MRNETAPGPSGSLEWLETNGLGDYASSTAICANSRRYHGLLVAGVPHLDRHVLLSTLEDWLVAGGEAHPLSTRHHPGVVHPRGMDNLVSWKASPCPSFVYEAGGCRIVREVALLRERHAVLVRYSLESAPGDGPVAVRVSPLLAFRFFHALTHANMDLQVKTFPARSGFKIQPYNSLPPLYVQAEGNFAFLPSPEWIYAVEYPIERERGFDWSEDLFSPGIFEIALSPGESAVLSASTEEIPGPAGGPVPLGEAWRREMEGRAARAAAPEGMHPLLADLAASSEAFLTRTPGGRTLIQAGYPWFGCWGRDALISLPGTTFLAGRVDRAASALRAIWKASCDGLVPNTFDPAGRARGFNGVDASLWVAWVFRLMLKALARTDADAARMASLMAPSLYSIVDAYRSGRVPFARVAATGLLEVGTPSTQLTWMDAQVDGRPVTPRHGFPVEIQALWYNTLSLAHQVAVRRGDPDPAGTRLLGKIRKAFADLFVKEDGSLVDVWRPESQGGPDPAVRPNQLIAVSMPDPVAPKESWGPVVRICRERLLTPYGLRTLDPADPAYRPAYRGGPAERDSAYHQGTVWPWLLGPYADAMLRAEKAARRRPGPAVRSLLETIGPLVREHRRQACVGHMSEIFSADPPHAPDGAFAQAWSEAEVFRALLTLREADGKAFDRWAEGLEEI